MRFKIIAAFALLVVATKASTQDASKQAPVQTASQGAKDSSCIFDFERGEVPNCLRRTPTGQLFIAARLLKGMRFD